MKTCTCRACKERFTSTKLEVFCSGRCRHIFTLTNPKNANRDGAMNDASNTEQAH